MKQKAILPKSFFRDHPLANISFARFSYFQMAELKQGTMSEIYAKTSLSDLLPKERVEQIAAENERISHLQTEEDVIQALRKVKESFCRDAIVKRALEMEDTVLPLLLQRYQTNRVDFFIEGAAHIFARADVRYAEALFADYESIRSDYARAQACLVFAAKDMKQAIPLLLTEMNRLKTVTNREFRTDLSQAPLLALYVLNNEPF